MGGASAGVGVGQQALAWHMKSILLEEPAAGSVLEDRLRFETGGIGRSLPFIVKKDSPPQRVYPEISGLRSPEAEGFCGQLSLGNPPTTYPSRTVTEHTGR